jgi:hypothetical protein
MEPEDKIAEPHRHTPWSAVVFIVIIVAIVLLALVAIALL